MSGWIQEMFNTRFSLEKVFLESQSLTNSAYSPAFLFQEGCSEGDKIQLQRISELEVP